MKILKLLTLLKVITAITNTNASSLKTIYTNHYIDQLITKFDKELDQKVHYNDRTNILKSSTYSKLQSARKIIKHSHTSPLKIKEINFIEINNALLYSHIINEIEKKAKPVDDKILIKELLFDGLIYYPSTGNQGNISGLEYPENTWSLTFDDGPVSKRSLMIAENLYEKNIQATFFMLTSQVLRFQDQAKKIIELGMEIGLHGYEHLALGKKENRNKVPHEITSAKKEIEEILNINLELFRLPYGSGLYDKNVRETIVENNLIHIFWSVDSLDWKDQNVKTIVARVKKQIQLSDNHSGVILFHDIHKRTVAASEIIMDYIIEKKYKICTVGEVVNYMNNGNSTCRFH